ncbi:MAG: hypothetical protein H6912_05110 [Kordiimonadaceae bacterium]|nr:hypothetical protein [Kordiimonadaceae bacterium]
MKQFFILFSLLFSVSASAQIPANLNKLEVMKADLVFNDFHDIGYMELDDQGQVITAWFFYKFISYEDVKTWEPGEKIDLVYNEKMGFGLRRKKTDMFYKVILVNEYDPIESGQEACLNKAYSTAEMVDCHRKAANQWNVEYNFLFQKLQTTLSDNLKAQIVALNTQLEQLAERYFQAYNDYLWPPGDSIGTIKYIKMADTNADFQKMKFKALLRFYF